MPISPLHRDPADAGDDWSVYTKKARTQISKLVKDANKLLRDGTLADGEQLLDFVRPRLESIGQGATDTIVKENVFYALDEAMAEMGVHLEANAIYGW